MFFQVYYSGRRPKSYGPEKNVAKYEVRLRRQIPKSKTVAVDFLFGDGVEGRGAGDFRGRVSQGFLRLSDADLEVICRRILDFIADPEKKADSMLIEEK